MSVIGRENQSADPKRLPARVRQSRILEISQRRGFVQVTDLASELNVSEMTIRRDLIELERVGQLSRTHGGAIMEEGKVVEPFLDREEPAFAARLREFEQEKRAIVAKAQDYIEKRATIALDVGTTTHLLAETLSIAANAKFFTSSLRTAQLLGGAKCDVYVPSGQVRGEELSICGKPACDEFEKYWFDVAFIGVSGVAADGLYDYSPEDSDLKRVYLRRSGKKILLCHSAKFNHMSLVKVSDLDAIDVLITDASPPPNIASALAKAHVEIVIAPPLTDI